MNKLKFKLTKAEYIAIMGIIYHMAKPPAKSTGNKYAAKIIVAIYSELFTKMSLRFIKGLKPKNTLTLTVAEACLMAMTIPGFYNEMDPHTLAVLSPIIMEIDRSL